VIVRPTSLPSNPPVFAADEVNIAQSAFVRGTPRRSRGESGPADPVCEIYQRVRITEAKDDVQVHGSKILASLYVSTHTPKIKERGTGYTK
jgi:hypothetical protein